MRPLPFSFLISFFDNFLLHSWRPRPCLSATNETASAFLHVLSLLNPSLSSLVLLIVLLSQCIRDLSCRFCLVDRIGSETIIITLIEIDFEIEAETFNLFPIQNRNNPGFESKSKLIPKPSFVNDSRIGDTRFRPEVDSSASLLTSRVLQWGLLIKNIVHSKLNSTL